MSKTLCKTGEKPLKKGKELKFMCKKCGLRATKEEKCCKPVRINKAA